MFYSQKYTTYHNVYFNRTRHILGEALAHEAVQEQKLLSLQHIFERFKCHYVSPENVLQLDIHKHSEYFPNCTRMYMMTPDSAHY